MIPVIQTTHQSMFVEAHIADLHFGVIDPATQYKILNEQFLNYLEYMNTLDLVSVNGDIFDHKFMANSDAVMYAIYFVNRLLDVCRRKKAALILISGTASHDADQLRLFLPLMQDNTVDVRVILESQFIYIKGKKILIIPELYGKKEEYYDSFLLRSGVYDACYMHGTFVGAIPTKNERDLNSDREPVFNIEDFNLCKGPIIAGHCHIHDTYKSHFYYCGSPIRWQFGEEQDKGFIILLHNIDTRQYMVHFEPIQSFRYDTVNLDYMLDQDPREIIDYIQSLKSNGIDFIRVRFTKAVLDRISILKNYYRTRSDVKIVTDFNEDRIKQELESQNAKFSEYDYMFDKTLTPEQIFVQYINQKENTDYWTVDRFYEFLQLLEKI